MVETFGDALRSVRTGAGDSQYDASQKLGVSETYYWKVESGRVKPSRAFISKLVTAYGVNGAEWETLAGRARTSSTSPKAQAPAPITRNTPPEALPCFLTVKEVSALLGVSEQSVREAILTGSIPKVPLPVDRVLIARGTVLRLACLSESTGATQELARRQAAVEVARERLGRVSGDLRAAEEALRQAEEALRQLGA